ncbi:DUF489 family protein, partial [Methylophaga sp. OBS4]|uniref:DUF489 family protein n=1 Tax=Methylophaga sp. OBS4 TaxID=2991935 RepID=UPI00224D2A43
MNISPRQRDRTIALAAVVQAASLVKQIAETGQVDQAELETMLNSLVVENAATTEA